MIDGVFVIDKPKGWTSFDVVNFIKKRFKLRRIGHAGTLDPLATGVLVILIGKATKLSERFINQDKEYIAELTVGKKTDTADAEGKVFFESEILDFSSQKLKKIFEGLKGERLQIPPMFSSVKYKGKRLYELARKGIEVNRRPRQIHIKEIDLLKVNLPKIKFFVRCSKGTYVRTLCENIGEMLGCGAYMSELRRIRSGDFSIDDAITINELKETTEFDLKSFRILGHPDIGRWTSGYQNIRDRWK